MLLRDFVDFMCDPNHGVARRKQLNQKFHQTVSQKNLAPVARIAVYSMDFNKPGRVRNAVALEFDNPQDFLQWNAQRPSTDPLTPAEKAPLPPNSPCFQPSGPSYPMPEPRVIKIEPTSVEGGKRTIKVTGEGLIPEVLEVYFVSKKTQKFIAAKTSKASASGDFRCGTVNVTATFPNVADTYSLNALNRADYLAFELPSKGLRLAVTKAAAKPKKKTTKKKSGKKRKG